MKGKIRIRVREPNGSFISASKKFAAEIRDSEEQKGLKMSFKQLEKKFPLESKVILINDEGFLRLTNGAKGIVVGYKNISEGEVLEIEWETGLNGIYFPWRVEIISSGNSSSTSSCPRCGGELEKKNVQISLFSEATETISKCKKCGWC